MTYPSERRRPCFEAMVAMQALVNLGCNVAAVNDDPDAFIEAREIYDEYCVVDENGSFVTPPEFARRKDWIMTCFVLRKQREAEQKGNRIMRWLRNRITAWGTR